MNGIKIAGCLFAALILAAVAGCGNFAKQKSQDSKQSANEAAEEPSTQVEGGAPAAVSSTFPWADFQRCGLIEIIKTEPGALLLQQKVASLPFTVAGEFSGKPWSVQLQAVLDLNVTLDTVKVNLTVDLFEPSEIAKAFVKTMGAGAPPWTAERVGRLPSFTEYADVNKRLDWPETNCSLISFVARDVVMDGVATHTKYDPGLPEILSPSATLEQLQAELGAGRTFPAVKVSAWEGERAEETKASEIVLSLTATVPTAENLATLKLEGKPQDYAAYTMIQKEDGKALDSQTTHFYSIATGKAVGNILLWSHPVSPTPVIIAFPPVVE